MKDVDQECKAPKAFYHNSERVNYAMEKFSKSVMEMIKKHPGGDIDFKNHAKIVDVEIEIHIKSKW